MKQMHLLIDREDPRCLYCGTSCEVKFSGEYLTLSPRATSEIDELSCPSCHEVFEIYETQAADELTSQTGFSFTCAEYRVQCPYDTDFFEIHELQGKFIMIVPTFEVDFSDKEKLREKLHTYIVFS